MGSRSRRSRLTAAALPAALLAVVAAIPLSAGAVSAEVRRCTITGTPARDVLVGTARRDVICGHRGDDVIRARGGDDIVYGGPGEDVVYPGGGNDRVVGGSGGDTFFSRDGRRDVIDGGADRDRIQGDRERTISVEEAFSVERGADPVLLAAGDIASCESDGDEATAVLLELHPWATVAAVGDTAYESGTDEEFARCYAPTWGRAKARTRPALGDHEYQTPGAAGYFRYFRDAAGEPGKGYYSYDLGSWHVVVLNTNCGEVGGCGVRSPQWQFLRDDLAAHPTPCTLAYWHHPRFTSGRRSAAANELWRAAYEGGVELVLSGDTHVYERFAPQDAAGASDPERGVRQFVVGTGGKSHGAFRRAEPQSEVRNRDTFGVLRLTLRTDSYAWRFVPVAGKRFTDAGTARCH